MMLIECWQGLSAVDFLYPLPSNILMTNYIPDVFISRRNQTAWIKELQMTLPTGVPLICKSHQGIVQCGL